MALPPLRHVDISQIEHEGQTLICIRDPEGIVDEPLILTPIAFFVASQLDGDADVDRIQSAFSHYTGGRMLRTEDIDRVVTFLDEHGYLMTPAYVKLRAEVLNAFAGTETRPAYLAGKSYPAGANELRDYINSLFTREAGPGQAPDGVTEVGDPVRCLVVPHIDFERGGHTYAHGFHRMARAGRPDTVIIFGVAHAGPPVPFIMTRKHFETPFGVVETDRELVERLAPACTSDPFEHEIVHRTEHSIEFQAVMLAYLYGSRTKIVPVLCGPFLSENDGLVPGDDGEVRAFLSGCREVAADSGRRITVIASADLAHVGHTFGDEFEIDETIIDQVRARDSADLAHVAALEPEAWYRSVMSDDNQRRVCGLNCIYSAMKSVEGAVTSGELVQYDYAPDPAGGLVSFANLVLS